MVRITLREQMDAALGSERAFTFLATFLAGVALLLSAIGLYGTLSSSVTKRAATFDPSAFALTAALLVVVVLTATLWPARRAAAVDPMRVMRTD